MSEADTTTRLHGRLRNWAVVLWAGVVVWASLAPTNMIGTAPGWMPRIPHADKIVHAGLYGMLALLDLWARQGRDARGVQPARRMIVRSLVFCGGFGLTMELMQGLLGYRSADWLDGLANLGGATLAAGVWHAARRHHARTHPKAKVAS